MQIATNSFMLLHSKSFSRADEVFPLQVGNFRVEPPGLFRGRGEHPKMGMLKRRIYPQDITINIGEGEEIPEHPYPGQKWKEVCRTATLCGEKTWVNKNSGGEIGTGKCYTIKSCLQ